VPTSMSLSCFDADLRTSYALRAALPCAESATLAACVAGWWTHPLRAFGVDGDACSRNPGAEGGMGAWGSLPESAW
jgi:hypothetical protein